LLHVDIALHHRYDLKVVWAPETWRLSLSLWQKQEKKKHGNVQKRKKVKGWRRRKQREKRM